MSHVPKKSTSDDETIPARLKSPVDGSRLSRQCTSLSIDWRNRRRKFGLSKNVRCQELQHSSEDCPQRDFQVGLVSQKVFPSLHPKRCFCPRRQRFRFQKHLRHFAVGGKSAQQNRWIQQLFEKLQWKCPLRTLWTENSNLGSKWFTKLNAPLIQVLWRCSSYVYQWTL